MPLSQGLLDKYCNFLPITPSTPIITLGEGNTPLVRSVALEKEIGCAKLYFKLEGCNPTGSFKDRGMVVAMAKAIEAGSHTAICASTGNTSASAAAYGARFGIKPVVIIPKGKIATGKLAQAIIYGAKIIAIEGNFDQALKIVLNIAERHPITLVNSLNPHRIEGQKTAAFEIVDTLGNAPDYFFIPVGNAGNITAYWKGFCEYRAASKSNQTPIMMGFQAAGAAPIVQGKPIEKPKTIATAIRIGNPASWKEATTARDASGGVIDSVTDDEIIAAYRFLASKEGIFGEPASAAPIAGIFKAVRQGLKLTNKRVVCIITGSGLKDPSLPTKFVETFRQLPPDLPAIERELGLV